MLGGHPIIGSLTLGKIDSKKSDGPYELKTPFIDYLGPGMFVR